jgi:hypothetical protein
LRWQAFNCIYRQLLWGDVSIRIMSLVWTTALPDSEKLVLLALADCANDDGVCWPSMRALVAKCSKTDRTIQAAIKSLANAGHLTRVERPGKGVLYTIHPASASGMEGYEPPQHHYVYRTTRVDSGEYYIGARSSLCAPADDPYMGSGKWLKQQIEIGAHLRKEVVNTYPSREALAVGEAQMTGEHFGQPLCRNARVATPATLTKRFRPEATSGGSDFGANATTPTPEAASDKPSRTIIPLKASPSSGARQPTTPVGEYHRLPEGWAPTRPLPSSTQAKIDLWPPGKIDDELAALHRWAANADNAKGKGRKLDWDAAWVNWLEKADSDWKPRSGKRPHYQPRSSNGFLDAVIDAERDERAAARV